MNQLLPVVRAMTYQVERVTILDVKTIERHGHGVVRKIKSAFSVKDLQESAIKNILLWQAEIYTTEELLEGKTLGGLFVDPETLLFKTIRLHTDKVGLERIDRPHPLLISMFIASGINFSECDDVGRDGEILAVELDR